MTQQNKALLSKIITFAQEQKDISLLGLIGSGSNAEKLDDEFSDIDLIMLTDNSRKYFDDDSWLSAIDEVWMSFTESAPDINHWERRCLFQNGLDVDFVLVDKELLRTKSDQLPVTSEICHKTLQVLVDKDKSAGLLQNIIGEEKAYTGPSEAVFSNLVNDFYFHCLWALKKCLRGEYWVALQCVNAYLKAKTLNMLEWHARSFQGPHYNTYYNGRFLERWIDASLREDLKSLFSDYDRGHIIDAIMANKEFFTKIARKTAGINGFAFPDNQLNKMTEWINSKYLMK